MPEGVAGLHRFDYPRPTVLVLGEEAAGASRRSSASCCRDLVRIPMVCAGRLPESRRGREPVLYEVHRAGKRATGRRPTARR